MRRCREYWKATKERRAERTWEGGSKSFTYLEGGADSPSKNIRESERGRGAARDPPTKMVRLAGMRRRTVRLHLNHGEINRTPLRERWTCPVRVQRDLCCWDPLCIRRDTRPRGKASAAHESAAGSGSRTRGCREPGERCRLFPRSDPSLTQRSARLRRAGGGVSDDRPSEQRARGDGVWASAPSGRSRARLGPCASSHLGERPSRRHRARAHQPTLPEVFTCPLGHRATSASEGKLVDRARDVPRARTLRDGRQKARRGAPNGRGVAAPHHARSAGDALCSRADRARTRALRPEPLSPIAETEAPA